MNMWFLCFLLPLISAKDPLIPSTGFIRGKVNDEAASIIRIIRQIPRNPICKTISFVNIPNPNAAPLMGKNEFKLITDKVYNGHFAWTNGPEFISYVNSAGPQVKGNWLLGNQAGVDSGYVYITTQSNSDLTPLHQESPTNAWKWLQQSRWEEFPELYMICMDDVVLPPVYYEIEHYHQTNAATLSYLIPNVNTFLEYQDPTFVSLFHLQQLDMSRLNSALFVSFQGNTLTSRLVTNIETVATFGCLSLLSPTTAEDAVTSKGSKKTVITANTSKQTNSYGILVNVEHVDNGWRLTYRQTYFTSTKYTSLFTNTIQSTTLAGDSEVIFTQNTTQSIQQNIETKEISLQVFANNFIQRTVFGGNTATTTNTATTGGNHDVTYVPYQILPLTSAKRQQYWDYWMVIMERVTIGDYLWVWYSPKLRLQPSSASTEGDGSSEYVSTEIEIEELFVQCIGKNTSHAFFRVHPTHRTEVMQESLLHHLTSTLILPLSNALIQFPHQAQGLPGYYHHHSPQQQQKIVIHTGMLIPKTQILPFLWSYLQYKEKELFGLSSCYMYHAAVSMPQVLVYANELLCILLGSKPVVMVQYNSPSEHQWKFPLIPQLTTALISLIASHPRDFPIDYRIFKYQADETLVFYHKSHTILMESLLPFHQAQALHPLPYIDYQQSNTTALLESYREQIYYAAWNGLILGYPERFVQYYCEDFHNNDLPREEKSAIFRNVKEEVQVYLQHHGLAPYDIHYGYIAMPQKDHWLEKIVDIVHHST